jgi:hypothetical protein
MVDSSYLDLSDVIETFDMEENARLLDMQLDSLKDDACETMIDNFKILYERYASIRDHEKGVDPEVYSQAEELFYRICLLYINHITEAFNFTVDSTYLEEHYKELPSVALQLYLFFVLDLRSNLFNVLLSFIGQHTKELAAQFEEMRQRRDAVSEVNRSMEDQDVALIASNIYDVVDWVIDQMTAEDFFANMEEGYVALAPMLNMYNEGIIDGGFMSHIRTIVKENISLKGRVCFDIICRLKGYDLNI